MGTESEPCKIVVEFAHHAAGIGAEGLWARPLGGDLYELDNIPFYAYGLSLADVVRAVAPDPDKKPVVRRVERFGGHRTLRVRFAESVSKPESLLMLRGLERFGTSFEGAGFGLFAVDVTPEGNYRAVVQLLDGWEDQGLLEYETCEARVPDGFGSPPEQ